MSTTVKHLFILFLFFLCSSFAVAQECGSSQQCYQMGQSKGYTKEAIPYYEKSLTLWTAAAAENKDSKAWVYNALGNTYYTLKEYPKAIQAYNGIIKFNPENKRYIAEAYMSRGNVMQAMDNLNGAVMSYTKAIETNPPQIAALTNRALVYRSLGKEEESINDLKAASRGGSKYALSLLYHDHKIDYYEERKAALAADEEWQTVQQLKTEANNLVKQKQYAAALEKYEEAEAILDQRGDVENPNDIIPEMAYISRLQGKYADAIADASRAAFSTHPTVSAFIELGYARYEKGDQVGGVNALDKGLERFPNNKSILKAKSWMYSNTAGRFYKSGDYKSAYNLYISAFNSNPSDANAAMNAGHAAYGGKMNKEALQAYRRAVQLDPSLKGKLDQYITYLQSVVR